VIRPAVLFATLAALAFGTAFAAPKPEALPTIGPAPPFALTAQDERRLSLADLRGKVVVLTFIYTTCTDTCPLLTGKLVSLQPRLGADFGRRVFFVGVTVDPERDTPARLKGYAVAHGARPEGWAFLTGAPTEIREVSKRYGVYAKKTARGDVDHTFLTSVIDARGTLRVQYMGVRFDPTELLGDVRALLAEAAAR
ncbi:MAG: SCO family protein, partial [Candidatus Rokuibacteriota bacterium]